MSKKFTTKIVYKFANDVWNGELSIAQLAKEYGITTRQVSRWKNDDRVIAILKARDKEELNKIKRTAIKYGERSVKSLIKLQEVNTVKEQDGSTRQEFNYESETVRKSACDILNLVINSKDNPQPLEPEDNGDNSGTLEARYPLAKLDSKTLQGISRLLRELAKTKE